MKYIFSICALIFANVLLVNAQIGKPEIAGNASISGKVLQTTGKPLIYTEIELVPVNADKQINDARLLATTGASGLFSFNKVPDGRYTLSINFDEKPSETSPYPTFFYPNATNRSDAEIFTVYPATRIKEIVFRLPPKLNQRKITGKVNGLDGKPVADAFIILRDFEFDDNSISFDKRTDKNGNFTITGFETRRYIIVAVLLSQLPSPYMPPGDPIAVGKTESFILDASNAYFILNLKELGIRNDVY